MGFLSVILRNFKKLHRIKTFSRAKRCCMCQSNPHTTYVSIRHTSAYVSICQAKGPSSPPSHPTLFHQHLQSSHHTLNRLLSSVRAVASSGLKKLTVSSGSLQSVSFGRDLHSGRRCTVGGQNEHCTCFCSVHGKDVTTLLLSPFQSSDGNQFFPASCLLGVVAPSVFAGKSLMLEA
jgi:hypothetical protein